MERDGARERGFWFEFFFSSRRVSRRHCRLARCREQNLTPLLPSSFLLLLLSFSFSPFSVYAAGNYTTAQFIKYGIPLQLLQFATVTVIFLLRPWKWILCGASVLLLVTVGLGIYLVHGASLSGLKRRAVLGKARRSGLFVAGEKAGADNGAAAPKAP